MLHVTNPVGWGIMATNGVLRGLSAANALKKMRAIDNAVQAHDKSSTIRTGTINGLAFAYKKLKVKAKREGAGAAGAGIYGATAAFKHKFKKNKGWARIEYAKILWFNAMHGDELAKAGCAALTYGKSDKLGLLEPSFYFNHENDAKIQDSPHSRKVLGMFRSIADSMKTT